VLYVYEQTSMGPLDNKTSNLAAELTSIAKACCWILLEIIKLFS